MYELIFGKIKYVKEIFDGNVGFVKVVMGILCVLGENCELKNIECNKNYNYFLDYKNKGKVLYCMMWLIY